ncbi:hypothetical protein HN385_03960 [archaeon]|jgi:hypothetical protein|nr:hypothetical protein [archaeon]MBT3450904.1 hypothetical protein [archaeon]MBT6869086.1 hypothetical protein [archaeon]MBT7193329.1 hypothetical protein [archaeon]MBT7380337.1 hypothetical protein [archaeon]
MSKKTIKSSELVNYCKELRSTLDRLSEITSDFQSKNKTLEKIIQPISEALYGKEENINIDYTEEGIEKLKVSVEELIQQNNSHLITLQDNLKLNADLTSIEVRDAVITKFKKLKRQRNLGFIFSGLILTSIGVVHYLNQNEYLSPEDNSQTYNVDETIKRLSEPENNPIENVKEPYFKFENCPGSIIFSSDEDETCTIKLFDYDQPTKSGCIVWAKLNLVSEMTQMSNYIFQNDSVIINLNDVINQLNLVQGEEVINQLNHLYIKAKCNTPKINSELLEVRIEHDNSTNQAVINTIPVTELQNNGLVEDVKYSSEDDNPHGLPVVFDTSNNPQTVLCGFSKIPEVADYECRVAELSDVTHNGCLSYKGYFTEEWIHLYEPSILGCELMDVTIAGFETQEKINEVYSSKKPFHACCPKTQSE